MSPTCLTTPRLSLTRRCSRACIPRPISSIGPERSASYFVRPFNVLVTHKESTVRTERINPSGLYNSVQFGFSHAVRQKGGDTLHLAGQVAWDKEGKLVGAGDLIVQTRQALANLKQVLAA